jgi:acetolactate synthase small subunit
MEQLYLEQLVVKPMPKKQEKIIVKVKIVDKTKEMHINRQMILNRLNNKNLLQVRKQVPISDNQIITIKKQKFNPQYATFQNLCLFNFLFVYS